MVLGIRCYVGSLCGKARMLNLESWTFSCAQLVIYGGDPSSFMPGLTVPYRLARDSSYPNG
jgi:hypothetical protein